MSKVEAVYHGSKGLQSAGQTTVGSNASKQNEPPRHRDHREKEKFQNCLPVKIVVCAGQIDE
jgi:hypothetical protein